MMILNWNKKLFFKKNSKRKYFIGFNLRLKYFNEGSYSLLEGMCLMLKSKRHKLLTSSIVILKKLINKDYVYYKLPLFLSGAYKYKRLGYTYRSKLFFCSRLNKRLILKN